MATILTAALLTSTYATIFAAENDGWTEASQTSAAKDGSWNKWSETWETIKSTPTQISLTPGKNATELNFAWYSKDSEANPKLKFGKNQDLSDAKELTVTTKDAVKGFKSNKTTATGLQENTTYYYSYQINGKWSEAATYKTKSTKSFSFLFVGDPQIGSSSGNTATGDSKEQGQDKATRNDAFNWNNTINTALKSNPNVSFMLSAGDQIQSSDKKNASQTYDKNEIEYSGYLSPNALKSLPVATTIGNHDAPSGNYSFHFNNPNASNLGFTEAGGDYYYTYGDALFIMLNTNNYNIAEHQQLIEKAISENKDAKWRVLTMHQDIYGSGEHSNEPDVVNLRYNLIPIFEKNNIDVVLTGHDHTYSRSFILKGGAKDGSKSITKDEFNNYIDGKTPIDSKYNTYLSSIEDSKAVQDVTLESGKAVNPKGILYMTANSASGSKYYDLVQHQQAYIASRWQEDVPTYSVIDISGDNFTINTYRTDNGSKIDNTFSIVKTLDKSNSNITVGNGEVKDTAQVDVVKTSADVNTKEATKSTNSVKTGDSFTVLPIIIAILSLSGLVVVNRKKETAKNK
jgi:predicted phosphodiesterase